jgi:hypothetical protein
VLSLLHWEVCGKQHQQVTVWHMQPQHALDMLLRLSAIRPGQLTLAQVTSAAAAAGASER